MLVANWKDVLLKSATVWVTAANIVVYIADHMEYLDMLPQQYRTALQTILLVAIPIARIIKQQSLNNQPAQQEAFVSSTTVKE
jgi:hypothetical protein